MNNEKSRMEHPENTKKTKNIFFIYNSIILYSFYNIIKYDRSPEFKT